MKLALITCHYNWFGFERPRHNLRRFLEVTKGLPVYGVEAQLPGHPMHTRGMPGWQQITADNDQVMMQKECLLNIAAAMVPGHFEALAWVDADILFSNKHWFDQTARALDFFPVVQPFSKAQWLKHDDSVSMERQGIGKEPDLLHRCVAHPGFAMAARRALWTQRRGGLYEHLVVGNGDVGFASAVLGYDQPGHIVMNPALRAHYDAWATPVKAWIKGRAMGCVPGTASHLWHGELKDRRYLERNDVLIKTLDPSIHLTHADNGLLTWTPAAPFGLRYAIRSHFANRREDG
jgi:hypothetical protein